MTAIIIGMLAGGLFVMLFAVGIVGILSLASAIETKARVHRAPTLVQPSLQGRADAAGPRSS